MGAGESDPDVDPSPKSDHGLAPSSFRACMETWYVVPASNSVMDVLVSGLSRVCSCDWLSPFFLYEMA